MSKERKSRKSNCILATRNAARPNRVNVISLLILKLYTLALLVTGKPNIITVIYYCNNALLPNTNVNNCCDDE